MPNNLTDSVIGQDRVISFLQRQIDSGAVSSAYLFSGIRYLGKELVARYFIKALACDSNQASICGVCFSCKLVDNNTHPDFFEVKREPEKQEITIDQIKKLRSRLNSTSLKQGYKSVIIHEADLMNLSSANAILKLLEEPYGKTIIILLDNREGKMPPTIVSRCQILNFYPVSNELICTWLINKGLENELAQEISLSVLFKPLLALDYANNQELWELKKTRLDSMIADIITGRYNIRVDLSRETDWGARQAQAKEWLEDYKFIWHNILLLKLNMLNYLQRYNNLKQLRQFVSRVDMALIIKKLDIINDACQKISYNVPGGVLINHLIYN